MRRDAQLGVGGRTGAAAADVLRDVVNLRAQVERVRELLESESERGEGGQGRTFSQFLSATMGPSVARVSAPRTMPESYTTPTMVVPVEVARGRPRFFASRDELRRAFSNEKPDAGWASAVMRGGVVVLRWRCECRWVLWGGLGWASREWR